MKHEQQLPRSVRVCVCVCVCACVRAYTEFYSQCCVRVCLKSRNVRGCTLAVRSVMFVCLLCSCVLCVCCELCVCAEYVLFVCASGVRAPVF